MPYLLNIIYVLVAALASPWLLYARLVHGKYREGWSEKLFGHAPKRESDAPCIWVHAVSVGEVNLLATLIERLQRSAPECEIVISTTTQTGFALAKKKHDDLTVFYCPLDFSWAVNEAMQRIRPSLLVLAELELWPNLISAAKQSGAKVAIANGRLSENSFRGYSRLGGLIAPVLRQIDLIAVQTEEYAQRFLALGARSEAVHCSGSIKFDGAVCDRNNSKTEQLSRLLGLKQNERVFLAGSTQAPEEQLALNTYRELVNEHPLLRLILVPRHPERFDEVAELLKESGLPFIRRTELEEDSPDFDSRILLVDVIGELGAWWGAAEIGFVGGSMGTRGGQNMIEPAAYGVAVCFGPKTKNFRDVVERMLGADAAKVVYDQAELTSFVWRCLADREYAKSQGDRAKELVRSQQGAADRTVALMQTLLPARNESNQRAA